MLTRFITGIFLAMASLCWILLAPAWLFYGVLTAIFILLTKEIWTLMKNDSFIKKSIFLPLYVGLPLLATWHIYAESPLTLLWVIVVVASTDVGAYLMGKSFGKRKIAPKISPNKTWEGLAGGAISAIITGIFLLNYSNVSFNLQYISLICIALACISQAGDFFASYLKRQAGVKDSGSLLPGHGGLLDRLDGHLFALPAFWLLLQF